MCQVEPLYSSLFSSFHGVPVLSAVFYFILITRFLSACSLNHFNTIVFVNLTFAPAYPVSLVSCWHGLFSCCISVHFTGLIPFISLFIVAWTCALSWWSSSVIYTLATMDQSLPDFDFVSESFLVLFAGLDWSLGADLRMTTHSSCALYSLELFGDLATNRNFVVFSANAINFSSVILCS